MKKEKYSHTCRDLDSSRCSPGYIWKSEKQKDYAGNTMGFSCSRCTDDQCITEPFLPDRGPARHRQYPSIDLLRIKGLFAKVGECCRGTG